MRYAGIIKNDITAGKGVCLSFFTQGCPLRCKGCHNPNTWDFSGGKEFTQNVLDEIIRDISLNGIIRPLCIMGGEPLCEDNLSMTLQIIHEVRKAYPELPIYIWTGNVYEALITNPDERLVEIMQTIDYLIDGPFMLELRDTTLPMRGSSNQRIIDVKNKTVIS